MRLRQVALAAHDLDAVTAQLNTVFGLKVAYNDPGIIHYGLKNAVLPAGDGFIEVVQPIRDDASAARFLKRRDGDAGYMLILQVADAEVERARAVALGVRVVDDIDSPAYRCAHFHPADFGGVLVSFDQQRTEADYLKPSGDWWPAGPDWRAARSAEVLDIAAVEVSTPDPAGLAARWAQLLGKPCGAAGREIGLDRGDVRFVHSETAGITAISLTTADPEAALSRARALGLDCTERGVRIGGVWFLPTV